MTVLLLLLLVPPSGRDGRFDRGARFEVKKFSFDKKVNGTRNEQNRKRNSLIVPQAVHAVIFVAIFEAGPALPVRHHTFGGLLVPENKHDAQKWKIVVRLFANG